MVNFVKNIDNYQQSQKRLRTDTQELMYQKQQIKTKDEMNTQLCKFLTSASLIVAKQWSI